jgi:hypothetical protein
LALAFSNERNQDLKLHANAEVSEAGAEEREERQLSVEQEVVKTGTAVTIDGHCTLEKLASLTNTDGEPLFPKLQLMSASDKYAADARAMRTAN